MVERRTTTATDDNAHATTNNDDDKTKGVQRDTRRNFDSLLELFVLGSFGTAARVAARALTLLGVLFVERVS